MKIKALPFTISICVLTLLLILWACSQSPPVSPLKSNQHIKSNQHKAIPESPDPLVRLPIQERVLKERQNLAKLRALKYAKSNQDWDKIAAAPFITQPSQDFSIQRRYEEQSINYNGLFSYYYNSLYAEPFTAIATDTISIQNGSSSNSYWKKSAVNFHRENFQISYEDYIDYTISGPNSASKVLARPDATYWYIWNTPFANEIDIWLKPGGQFFVSSTPDGKGAVSAIGQLRYRIYTRQFDYQSLSLIHQGILENNRTPVDLQQQHSLDPDESYYLELFLTKPDSGDQQVGLNKPLYLVSIHPLTRATTYLDIDLKSPRYISPNNSSDKCGDRFTIQVHRPPGIETSFPQHDDATVWIYKYPSFDDVGAFPALGGKGSYTFTWDGKDPNGNPLPDGMYNIEVQMENRRTAPGSTQDRVDWLILHIANNGATDEQCAYFENPGVPEETEDRFCETFSYPNGQPYESCFVCPEAQQIVYTNGRPTGCSGQVQTDQAHMPYGEDGPQRAFYVQSTDSCAAQ